MNTQGTYEFEAAGGEPLVQGDGDGDGDDVADGQVIEFVVQREALQVAGGLAQVRLGPRPLSGLFPGP